MSEEHDRLRREIKQAKEERAQARKEAVGETNATASVLRKTLQKIQSQTRELKKKRRGQGRP